nr:hypothetical protein [Micromonospora costi]
MDVPPLLIVDAANVVGSRPDGWWRDRAGATARLRDSLTGVAAAGLPQLPPPVEVVLVVEGRARDVPGVPGVAVVAARGSGDDAVVELVGADPGRRRVVVTADRELRDRVTARGAEVYGPRWLRDAVPAPDPASGGGAPDGGSPANRTPGASG